MKRIYSDEELRATRIKAGLEDEPGPPMTFAGTLEALLALIGLFTVLYVLTSLDHLPH